MRVGTWAETCNFESRRSFDHTRDSDRDKVMDVDTEPFPFNAVMLRMRCIDPPHSRERPGGRPYQKWNGRDPLRRVRRMQECRNAGMFPRRASSAAPIDSQRDMREFFLTGC